MNQTERSTILAQDIKRAKAEEKDFSGKNHVYGHYAKLHDHKYSPRTGYDYSKLIVTMKAEFKIGNFLFYAEMKQAGNSYYIHVLNLTNWKTDLIHYSDSKNYRQVMKEIKEYLSGKEINHGILQNLKWKFYNGSGSNKIYDSLTK